MEIKLTNVARASLEELLIDYRDFLRTRGEQEWEADHPWALRLRQLNRQTDSGYETFRKGIEHAEPAICANVIIGPDQSHQLSAGPADQSPGTGLSERRRPARTHDPRPTVSARKTETTVSRRPFRPSRPLRRCRPFRPSEKTSSFDGKRSHSTIHAKIGAEVNRDLHPQISVPGHAGRWRRRIPGTCVGDLETDNVSISDGCSRGCRRPSPHLTRSSVVTIEVRHFIKTFVRDAVPAESIHQHLFVGSSMGWRRWAPSRRSDPAERITKDLRCHTKS